MRPGLREFRAVYHCHSFLSHDSDGSLDEITTAARDLGFNVVFLNDHYEPGNIRRSPRDLHNEILVIPGVETRLDRRGSLLASGMHSDFDTDQDEPKLLASLEEDGGFLALSRTCTAAPSMDSPDLRALRYASMINCLSLLSVTVARLRPPLR